MVMTLVIPVVVSPASPSGQFGDEAGERVAAGGSASGVAGVLLWNSSAFGLSPGAFGVTCNNGKNT